MASPTDSGCTSSLKYAIATAGSPLNAAPSSARTARNPRQPGMSADTMVSAAAAASENTITDFRPHASEMDPATRIDTASRPVVSDSDRLLAAGLTWNSRENTAISGCTQYSSANVENPAMNTATFVRRNAGVPRLIGSEVFNDRPHCYHKINSRSSPPARGDTRVPRGALRKEATMEKQAQNIQEAFLNK